MDPRRVTWWLLGRGVPVDLPPTEHDRDLAQRLPPERRAAWLRRRAFLRQVLATELGTEPSSVRIERGEDGRPCLVGHHSVHFSSSSSGGVALVATATGAAVGVDIEMRASVPRLDGMAARYLNEQEAAAIARHADPHGEFLRLWTRKEAVVKGLGKGLRIELRDVPVLEAIAPVTLDRQGTLAEAAGTGWRLIDLRLPDHHGHIAAIAVSPPSVSVVEAGRR